MRWVRNIFAELFGLFVDDDSFAVAIILWVGLVTLGIRRLALPSAWQAVLLFAGLGLILAVSALRGAQRR